MSDFPIMPVLLLAVAIFVFVASQVQKRKNRK